MSATGFPLLRMGTSISLTIEHEGRGLGDLAHIPRFLLELPDGRFLGRLTLVHQASRNLDDNLVDGWSVLSL